MDDQVVQFDQDVISEKVARSGYIELKWGYRTLKPQGWCDPDSGTRTGCHEWSSLWQQTSLGRMEPTVNDIRSQSFICDYLGRW
jgi:hypothetical protein